MSSKKHRILFVEKPPFVGGSITGLFELVRNLDRSQYEPVMLFHGPNPYREKFSELDIQVETLSEELPSTESTRQVRDIAASLGRYSRHLSSGYQLSKQLYLLLKKERPQAQRIANLISSCNIDLVHHNNSLPGNQDTIMAASMAGVPQVSHVRMLHEFSPLERYMARSVDAFVYMSRAIESLYQGLGITESRGRVIYDAFEPTPYTKPVDSDKLRAELGLPMDAFVVSITGRIDWWKGHDDFIRAIADVVRVEKNTKALIVGAPDTSASSQEFDQKVHSLVSELNLEEHVIFTGFRSDVPQIMMMSDVIVHGSSEPEPFGRVVVEGMLAGRPVIATAAGGVLDIIDDKETGLLVPIRSPKAMAEAILYLAQNPEAAKTMSVKAKKQAVERFSVEQHVRQVQELYQAILN